MANRQEVETEFYGDPAPSGAQTHPHIRSRGFLMDEETARWLHSYSRVTLTVEIPEDVFSERKADLLNVVVPFCHEGMRPEGLAFHINLALREVVKAARHALAEKGYISASDG